MLLFLESGLTGLGKSPNLLGIITGLQDILLYIGKDGLMPQQR